MTVQNKVKRNKQSSGPILSFLWRTGEVKRGKILYVLQISEISKFYRGQKKSNTLNECRMNFSTCIKTNKTRGELFQVILSIRNSRWGIKRDFSERPCNTQPLSVTEACSCHEILFSLKTAKCFQHSSGIKLYFQELGSTAGWIVSEFKCDSF